MSEEAILALLSILCAGLAAFCLLMRLMGEAAKRLLGDVHRRVDDIFLALGAALIFAALALRLARDLIRPEAEAVP